MAQEALRALEAMLLSQERRESQRVQQSLQMMQSQMALRQQSIGVMSQNLDLLKKSNDSMKMKAASQFLQESGLSNIYLKYKDDGSPMKNAVKALTSGGFWQRDSGGMELDESTAQELVSATWLAMEGKDPDSIVRIGATLSNLEKEAAGGKYSNRQKKILTALAKMGAVDLKNKKDSSLSFKLFDTMQTTIDNDIKLNKEISDFVKGDYEIDETFSLIDETLKETQGAPQVEEKEDDVSGTQIKSSLPIDKQLSTIDEQVSDLEKEKDRVLNGIKNIEEAERTVNTLRQSGLEPNQEDLEILENKDAFNEEYNKQLEKLNKDISQMKEAKRLFKIESYEKRKDDLMVTMRKQSTTSGPLY